MSIDYYRNQFTTSDTLRAKKRITRLCLKCGTGVTGAMRYCGPCSHDRRLERERNYHSKKKEAGS